MQNRKEKGKSLTDKEIRAELIKRGLVTPAPERTYDADWEENLPPDDVCCCGDSMEGHPKAFDCGHTPVSMRAHALMDKKVG